MLQLCMLQRERGREGGGDGTIGGVTSNHRERLEKNGSAVKQTPYFRV